MRLPDWDLKLDRYGSTQLWRDTLRDFACASPLLPEGVGSDIFGYIFNILPHIKPRVV